MKFTPLLPSTYAMMSWYKSLLIALSFMLLAPANGRIWTNTPTDGEMIPCRSLVIWGTPRDHNNLAQASTQACYNRTFTETTVTQEPSVWKNPAGFSRLIVATKEKVDYSLLHLFPPSSLPLVAPKCLLLDLFRNWESWIWKTANWMWPSSLRSMSNACRLNPTMHCHTPSILLLFSVFRTSLVYIGLLNPLFR